MQGQYNMRSPAVKRLMKEAQELSEPTENFHAQPLEDNLFEWHFTLRGPEDSEFEGGIYHGRIILPPEYPMKPPSIILLTPNGRFEIFKKICLSISGHHPESWQPSWSIRTALLALIGFMPTHGGGAIGSLDYTPEERKVLAKKSQDWKCPDCGVVSNKLKPVTQASEKVSQEAKILAAQINFQGEKKGSTEAKSDGQSGAAASDSATPTSTSATTSTPASPAMPAAAPTGPFPFPWAMPPGWTPPATGASGAAAFPRFPYPPPFMVPPPGMGGQSQISPQQMPFFPPPMPFFPPMYQGLPPFPAQPASVGGTAPSANTTVTASASSQPRVTPSATASGGAAVSSAAVASAIKTPAPATAPQVRATDTTSSATPSSTETDSSYTVSDTDSSAAAASTRAATLSVTTTSTPTSSAPTTATPSGLRQRQTGAAPSPPQQSATTTTTDTREAESQRVSLVMMVVLAFAIGLLLARRMYIQFFSPHFRGVMN